MMHKYMRYRVTIEDLRLNNNKQVSMWHTSPYIIIMMHREHKDNPNTRLTIETCDITPIVRSPEPPSLNAEKVCSEFKEWDKQNHKKVKKIKEKLIRDNKERVTKKPAQIGLF